MNATPGRKRRVRRPPSLIVDSPARVLDAGHRAFRLAVSAPKLCKFRKYQVELTVGRAWRVHAQLTEAAVFSALLAAKCCRSGTTVPVGCPRCKCQPVVVLTPVAQRPVHNPATDEETYTCTVQSKCSSSRDHLKSALVLVVNTLPAMGEVVSDTFVLLARDKGKGKKQLALELCRAAPPPPPPPPPALAPAIPCKRPHPEELVAPAEPQWGYQVFEPSVIPAATATNAAAAAAGVPMTLTNLAMVGASEAEAERASAPPVLAPIRTLPAPM